MRDLLRLARLVLPLWRWILLGVLLALATVLAHVGLLALSSWFIASMAVAGAMGAVFNYTTPAAAVRALAIARAGGRYGERLVNHGTTFRILSSLRVWFYRRIEPLAPAGLDMHRSGDLLARIQADIDVLDDFYVRGLVPAIVAVLALAVIIPFLCLYDWRLAALDAAALACGGVIVPLLLRKPSRRAGQERVAWAAELRSLLVEEIQGLAELEALGAEEQHVEHLQSAAREMDRRQRSMSALQGLAEAGTMAAGVLAAGAAGCILVPVIGAGLLPRPDMAMLTVFMLASFEAVLPLPVMIQRAGEMAAAAHRLFEIIDAPPAVVEPAAPVTREQGEGPAQAIAISISGLSFRYSRESPWILRDFSLEAPAGATIGIQGPTGIGKSTLVEILLRFREYEEGSIRITTDSADRAERFELRSLGGEGARGLFSVVPQSPYLFHASIRENLLIADEAASDDEMWAALEAAALSDFVSSLSEGLNAIVGETGRELSTGEARRLAVARALLKDAPAFIFDEPTEGLDDLTAEAMLAGIEARLAGRTVLMISHRPRDLSFAGRIVHMG